MFYVYTYGIKLYKHLISFDIYCYVLYIYILIMKKKKYLQKKIKQDK